MKIADAREMRDDVVMHAIGEEFIFLFRAPILERQLKKGARVIAHDFEFPQWTSEKILNLEDDGEGRSHRLYLYRR